MNVLRSASAVAVIIAVMALSACSGGGEATDPQPDTGKVIADAGQDQSVSVGAFVTLNGSKSTNANQTGLTYAWTLAKPASSSATLSNTRSVTPTLTVDVEGTYEATLVVTDARQTNLSSDPDSVLVIAAKTNLPPTADAGKNQDVFVNRAVLLDGSGSRASGNKQLTFNWSFKQRPTGSASTLSDPTRVNPSFIPDQIGPYVLQLIVNDGTKSSTADEVTITAAVKPRPTADAGPNQSAIQNSLVTLDGSKSKAADNGQLTFSWSLTKVPDNSNATLANADTKSPTFTADQLGTYVAQLVVNDGTDDSEPKTVDINVSSTLPIAKAAADPINPKVCRTVTLNGSASTTRSGGSIAQNSYGWMLDSKPTTSSASLSNATTVSPSFTTDLAGNYQASLEVTEIGENAVVLKSQKVNVTVIATPTYQGEAKPDVWTRNTCAGCHPSFSGPFNPNDKKDLSKKGFYVEGAFDGNMDPSDHRNIPLKKEDALEICDFLQTR